MESRQEANSIHDDVRRTLRTSFVPRLFRELGEHPPFLPHMWKALKPAITSHLERSADGVRNRAVSELSALDPPDHRPKLGQLGYADETIREISGQLQVHHYTGPKLLLIALALHEALTGGATEAASLALWPLGRGVPAGMPQVELANLEAAGERASRLASQLCRSLDLATVTDELRTIAQWPNYLELAVQQLLDRADQGFYREALKGIRQEAEERARALPRQLLDLTPEALEKAGVDRESQQQIREKVELSTRALPVHVLDVAYLVHALLGLEEAKLAGEVLLRRWAVPPRAST